MNSCITFALPLRLWGKVLTVFEVEVKGWMFEVVMKKEI